MAAIDLDNNINYKQLLEVARREYKAGGDGEMVCDAVLAQLRSWAGDGSIDWKASYDSAMREGGKVAEERDQLLSRVADLEERLRDMTDRYHESSGEADRLHDRINHAGAYATAGVARLRARVAELEVDNARIGELDGDREILRARVAELEAKPYAKENARLAGVAFDQSKRVAELEALLAAAHCHRKEHVKQLEDEAALSEAQTRIAELEAKLQPARVLAEAERLIRLPQCRASMIMLYVGDDGRPKCEMHAGMNDKSAGSTLAEAYAELTARPASE